MKKSKHCNPLSQVREAPAYAQDGADGPRSALEIKKDGLLEAATIVRNARRAKPWLI